MKHVLLAYYSHAGHTARIARRIAETIEAEGSRCDVVSMMEAVREGVDWDKYDIVIVGSPIVYGVYNRVVWGVLYHETFPKLRYGFNDEVRNGIRQELENSLNPQKS